MPLGSCLTSFLLSRPSEGQPLPTLGVGHCQPGGATVPSEIIVFHPPAAGKVASREDRFQSPTQRASPEPGKEVHFPHFLFPAYFKPSEDTIWEKESGQKTLGVTAKDSAVCLFLCFLVWNATVVWGWGLSLLDSPSWASPPPLHPYSPDSSLKLLAWSPSAAPTQCL